MPLLTPAVHVGQPPPVARAQSDSVIVILAAAMSSRWRDKIHTAQSTAAQTKEIPCISLNGGFVVRTRMPNNNSNAIQPPKNGPAFGSAL